VREHNEYEEAGQEKDATGSGVRAKLRGITEKKNNGSGELMERVDGAGIRNGSSGRPPPAWKGHSPRNASRDLDEQTVRLPRRASTCHQRTQREGAQKGGSRREEREDIANNPPPRPNTTKIPPFPPPPSAAPLRSMPRYAATGTSAIGAPQRFTTSRQHDRPTAGQSARQVTQAHSPAWKARL